MIQNVLPVIVGELNDYLKSQFNTLEDKALLSNIVDQSGSIEIEDRNKIVVNLINVEEETTLKSAQSSSNMGGGFVRGASPINVNLTVLFSAYFNAKNYAEALKFLSGVIYFFQSRQVFNSANTPGLTSAVDKITFQMMNLNMQELNMVCSMLGYKYMPSVVYKLRMLPFLSDDIVDEIPGISGIGINDPFE